MTNDHTMILSDLSRLCRLLKLTQNLAHRYADAPTDQARFLRDVLAVECERRTQNRIALRLSRAGFPVLKSLDDYDFRAVTLPAGMDLSSMLALDFIRQKQNLILYGPVGTGKTHLTTGLGALAYRHDLRVRFYTVAGLVLRLGEAHRNGTLEKVTRELDSLDLLILDEWGYIPVDRHGSQLLFRVIADSYERKSIVLTTNVEFSRWGTIFTDEQMAAAMIDRLIHHGYLLMFEGKSYRLTHALMSKSLHATDYSGGDT